MTMPRVGSPEHAPVCTAIEAATEAEAAGMHPMADCLKMVVVAQVNGSCEQLRDYLTSALLVSAAYKSALGLDDDVFESAADGFHLELEEFEP